MTAGVSIGKVAGLLAVRLRGDGTWQEARVVYAWLRETVDAQTKGVVVDLAGVAYLDSTFIGTLVGIARELDGRPSAEPAPQPREVALYGVGARLRSIFRELGVPNVIRRISDEAFPYEVLWQEIPVGWQEGEAVGRHVLHAHELLMDIDESNVARFEEAVNMLRSALAEEADEAAETDAGLKDRG